MSQQPNSSSKWLILASVGIGTFMTALDSSVVNVILPLVRQGLKSDFASSEWIVTIYLLVLSGLLLSFGRLGDLYGHKMVYLAGFGIFVGSSALCGLAPNITVLVVCRAVQALGAAMLAANSPAILTSNFPPQQRGQVLGLSATMTYLGLVTGPSVGGWLAHVLNWRAVFYINVPIGIGATLLSLRYIPNDHRTSTDEHFDWPGAGSFTVGLCALLLGLNQGHAWGWASPATLASFLLAVSLLAVFLVMESRIPSPMLDLKLFRSPVFSFTVLSAILNYVCIYSIIFLMPQYLIVGRGLDSARAGLMLTSQSIVMAITAPLSGTFSDRAGTRWPAMVGMSILAAGTLLLSGLNATSNSSWIVLELALVGLGTGMFISPNNSALMGAAPSHRQGIAAGTLATARSFGMVLGAGLAGAIYTTMLTHTPGDGLYQAVRASFLAAGVIAAMGVVTSAVRSTR